ncbi:hypothetical protein VTL71DRAFT_12711 [Oculimacula yallundae]|uniref:Chromatin modification-related protein EAF3 n=1 Tax=Oculimacula yallundae TaxID=86028 RepID=A0ABR4CQI7_9HELO
MAPSKAAAASSPYAKDERVLCFHHEMLYEAKILDVRMTDEKDPHSWQFKIHYKGWKNTFTDENKELAAQLHNQMKALQNPGRGGPKSTTKGRGGRANGSDFSSARGSEERYPSAAAQSGRGGPRRHRDYDLEHHLSLLNFMALLGAAPISSNVDMDYGSDTTISEDWKAIYHPASCQCGNHSETAAWRVTPGQHNDNRFSDVPDNDKISRVLRWRKRVKRHNPATSSADAAINQASGVGFNYDNCFSTNVGPPTPSIAIVNDSRLFKVNSSAGTIPRQPTSRTSSSHPPPKFHTSSSKQTQTGKFPIGIPKFAWNNSVLPIDKTIDPKTMPPIIWKVTYGGSSNKFATAEKKGSYNVLGTESMSVGSRAEGAIGDSTMASIANPLDKAGAVVHISYASRGLATKAPDVVEVVSPKTPSPVRIKLVVKTPPRPVTSSGDATKELILPKPKTVPTTKSLKRTSSANPTAARVSTRCSKRKSTSDITIATQEQLNTPAPIPVYEKTKVLTKVAKVVRATRVAPGKATDKATSKAAITSNTKRKASKISVNKSDPNNLTEDKLATTIALPAMRIRKSRATMDSSPEASMEDEIEPIATIATTILSRAARAARRRGEDEEEELMALPATKKRRKYQDWADPKSDNWDIIRFLQDDSMLAKDDLLKLPSKNFSYIDEVTMKLKNPNKYSQPMAPQSISRQPETGDRSKPGPRGKGQNTKPGGKASANAPVGAEEMIDEKSDGSSSAGAEEKIDVESDDSSSLSSISPSISEPSVTPASSHAHATPTPIKKKTNKKEFKDKADDIFFYFPDLVAKYDVLTNLDIQEETFLARPSIQLPVPDHIKAILVDDWENVTKNNQLVPLPAPYPVNKILDDYLESEMSKRQAGSAAADILDEVVAGLKEYFDKTLGRILLYRFERCQYIEVRDGFSKSTGVFAGKTVGDTYGAEHLCRLIVTLPELIAQTNMDAQSSNRLREELTTLSFWIGRNTPKYFASEYETPSPEYVERYRSEKT